MTGKGGEHLGASMLNVYSEYKTSLILGTHCPQSFEPSAFTCAWLKLKLKCYLHVSPCYLSLYLTAHYWDTWLAPLPFQLHFCLEMDRWSHGKFWRSNDRQLPRLLSINLAHLSFTFLRSHLVSITCFFKDLTDTPLFPPHSTPALIPVWTSFYLPVKTSLKHPIINVKICPRAPNITAECI